MIQVTLPGTLPGQPELYFQTTFNNMAQMAQHGTTPPEFNFGTVFNDMAHHGGHAEAQN